MKYEYDPTPFARFRDRLARRIANFALNRIATPWYRSMIGGSILLGLETASKEG